MIRALVLMALLAVAAPAAALAHATLTTSQPGEGARLAAPPATVTLTFASDVRVVSLLLKQDSAADVPLPLPSPGFARSISAPLPPLAPGAYEIEWHAAAKDMHAVSGAVHFTVAPSPPAARAH
ncbi:MAG: copper resistance protein CopC [Rhodospirillales bacterium]